MPCVAPVPPHFFGGMLMATQALVVETGAGVPNADAYADEAFVTQYLENFKPSSDWTGASADLQIQSIRTATQYIDAKFGTRWQGTTTNEKPLEQGLDWPRIGVVDAGGRAVDDDVLPVELKQACAVLAESATTDDLFTDIQNPGSIKRKKVKVSSIEQDITYFGGSEQQKVFTLAEQMLKQYLGRSNRLVRV